MRHTRVEGQPNFVRDETNNAILNTVSSEDIHRLREVKKQRKQREQEIEQLKSDVSEIKFMLTTLMKKMEE
jgi:Tfp pilus assembly protein PilN